MTRPVLPTQQWPVIDGRELLAELAEFERRILAGLDAPEVQVAPDGPEVPR